MSATETRSHFANHTGAWLPKGENGRFGFAGLQVIG